MERPAPRPGVDYGAAYGAGVLLVEGRYKKIEVMDRIELTPDGELCRLGLNGDYMLISSHGQWAGPIPTPQEPKS